MGGHAILGSHAVPGFSSGEKRCVTTQMLDAKLHLDPAFYHSVFLQFLFLTIANELYCITSSDWLSLDHAVKNLALTQRGLAWERVIFTCGKTDKHTNRTHWLEWIKTELALLQYTVSETVTRQHDGWYRVTLKRSYFSAIRIWVLWCHTTRTHHMTSLQVRTTSLHHKTINTIIREIQNLLIVSKLSDTQYNCVHQIK